MRPPGIPGFARAQTGLARRTRNLERRGIPNPGEDVVWETWTPDLILEKKGGGTDPTQPDINFQQGFVLYPPGGVIQAYSPIFAIFNVGIDDPGVAGSSGQAIYRISMPTACPADVDGSVVGSGLFAPVNPGGGTDVPYYPMTLIANDDGYLGLALPIPNTTVPGSGTRAGTNWAPQPDWPEDLNNPGLGQSAIFNGSFMYPSAP